MGIADLDYGVEVIYGLMGSGKSFFCVQRAVKVVQQQRRPLYTNLPMKWPTVKAYLRLKGGEDLANLFRRLDEKHWRSFLVRQHAWAKFREQNAKRTPADFEPEEFDAFVKANDLDPERARAQHKLFNAQLMRWFISLNGPHVIDGPGANWIPPGSIICIDECQHWHPMTNQGKDPNRPDLLAYLTMCRHHVHWLWFVTQDPANVAVDIRRLYHYAWRVWNRGEDRLAWGIRWKHLGLKAMGYEKATPDQEDAMQRRPGSDNARPTEKFTILPWLARNQVFFRLYSSHTNIASPREMARELRQFRVAAGLAEDGAVTQRLETHEIGESKLSRFKRYTRVAALLVLVSGMSYAVGTIGKSEPVEDLPEVVELPPLEWPRWAGRGTKPIIDGRRVSVGEPINDRVVLDYVADDGRSLVLRSDGAVWWLWRYGEAEPIRVGEVESVRAAVERLRDEYAASGSDPRPDPAG